MGKTSTGGLIAADACLRLSNETVAVLARWQDTADEMWDRMESHFKSTGLSNKQLGIVTDNAREKEFDNGTRAICRPLPQDADAFRGKLSKVVIVDEGALVADPVFSRVIEPMFITHGYNHELVVMSTPRGKTGYHFKKHREDDSFESFTAATTEFIPKAVEAGVVDPTAAKWLEDKSREYDKKDPLWQTEFLGQFADVGDPYLPRDLVKQNVNQNEDPKLTGSLYLGVDVGHRGDDRSVYTAVDEHGSVGVEAAPQTETVPDAVDRIERLDNQNGYAGIAVDATGGLGAAVDDYTDGLHHVEPFRFTSRSRANIYQRLKRMLEGEELSLPNDPRLIEELTSLRYDFSNSGILQVEHPPSGHDDFSESLCLALEARANGKRDDEFRGLRNKAVLGTVKQQSQRSLESLMSTR